MEIPHRETRMAAKKIRGTVGVIGLGIMGGAFARNLVSAGWRVVGYDTSPARQREARRAGVEIGDRKSEECALRFERRRSLSKRAGPRE